MGSDISAELIKRARAHDERISYHVASAEKLSFAADTIFSAVASVLMLQNVEHLEPVFLEAARVLTPRGRFIGIINHPAFRVPQRSSWGFDDDKGVQFRRLDGYLSASRSAIDMHPGTQSAKAYTYSHHRSMQDYSKALRAAGFAIVRMEEWISNRHSEAGPRKKAEDTARKEFPLFLAFEAMKAASPGNL
jgi:ubiquinone/menaquinone biosynthesis C-methylase UbiE